MQCGPSTSSRMRSNQAPAGLVVGDSIDAPAVDDQRGEGVDQLLVFDAGGEIRASWASACFCR